MQPIDLEKSIYLSLHKRLPKNGEYLDRSEVTTQKRVHLDNAMFSDIGKDKGTYNGKIQILITEWCQPAFVMLSYHQQKGKSCIGGFELKIPECNEGDVLVLDGDKAHVIAAPPPEHTKEEVVNLMAIFGSDDTEESEDDMAEGESANPF